MAEYTGFLPELDILRSFQPLATSPSDIMTGVMTGRF